MTTTPKKTRQQKTLPDTIADTDGSFLAIDAMNLQELVEALEKRKLELANAAIIKLEIRALAKEIRKKAKA